MTRKDKEAANKNLTINLPVQPDTLLEKRKDSEPRKPDKEPTEAEKRREVWQVANELMEPPPNCLATQDFWGMHRDRRRVYTGILKTRIGYIPNCYTKPRAADKPFEEKAKALKGTERLPVLTFPPKSFDPRKYRKEELDTQKNVYDNY